MAETSLHALKAKETWLVVDWLKSKGLHKLCSVFEPIMGHLNSFSASEGGNLNKNFSKIQMLGQPRSQGLFPGLAPLSSQGKGPGNEVDARGVPGGMFKLRFDWYITVLCETKRNEMVVCERNFTKSLCEIILCESVLLCETVLCEMINCKIYC